MTYGMTYSHSRNENTLKISYVLAKLQQVKPCTIFGGHSVVQTTLTHCQQ